MLGVASADVTSRGLKRESPPKSWGEDTTLAVDGPEKAIRCRDNGILAYAQSRGGG